MRNTGKSDQNQVLRSMEPMYIHENFDVTSDLMLRIHQNHDEKSGASLGIRRKRTLIAILCTMVLLSSITVYASSKFIQIKNKEGKIIITSIAQQTDTYVDYYVKLLSKYETELKKKLKPGERVAYYIKDKEIQAAETLNPLYFLYVPHQHPNYADFAEEMKAIETPQILEPTYMPEGYSFKTGNIQAMPEPFVHTPEYEQLLGELRDLAEKSTDNQALFYKIIPWSKGSSSMIQYRKGERLISINAYAKSTNSTVQVPAGNAEKLTVNGTEMLLTSPERNAGKPSYGRRLTWLDDSGLVLYTIMDDPQDPLSNEEFAKIAAGMMWK